MNVYSITDGSGQMLSKLEVDELLHELGISDDAITEGTDDAIEKDAAKNKIDLTQLNNMAKEEYGDKVNGSADSAKQDFQSQLKALGIPDSVIIQGNKAVQAYAVQNGITLPSKSGTSLNFKS